MKNKTQYKTWNRKGGGCLKYALFKRAFANSSERSDLLITKDLKIERERESFQFVATRNEEDRKNGTILL